MQNWSITHLHIGLRAVPVVNACFPVTPEKSVISKFWGNSIFLPYELGTFHIHSGKLLVILLIWTVALYDSLIYSNCFPLGSFPFHFLEVSTVDEGWNNDCLWVHSLGLYSSDKHTRTRVRYCWSINGTSSQNFDRTLKKERTEWLIQRLADTLKFS